jgi:hypothetical protein
LIHYARQHNVPFVLKAPILGYFHNKWYHTSLEVKKIIRYHHLSELLEAQVHKPKDYGGIMFLPYEHEQATFDMVHFTFDPATEVNTVSFMKVTKHDLDLQYCGFFLARFWNLPGGVITRAASAPGALRVRIHVNFYILTTKKNYSRFGLRSAFVTNEEFIKEFDQSFTYPGRVAKFAIDRRSFAKFYEIR